MIILNLIVFVVLLFVLFKVFQSTQKLGLTVFVGLFLGLIGGALMQNFYDKPIISSTLDWINIVGSGYVRLLQMIVMPLVFISILAAITRLHNSKSLGKVSLSVLSVLLLTTAIAAAIGIAMAYMFDLSAEGLVAGERELAAQLSISGRAEKISSLTIPSMLVSFIPKNPFAELTGANPTSIISTVIFAALLGIAALNLSKQNQEFGERIASGVELLNQWIIRLVRFIISLTPYGVFALMTKMAAVSVWSDVVNLGSFIVASYLALLSMFVIHGILLFVFKVNPLDYYKKVLPVLSFAFSSRSSAATIPLNIETQTDKLGNDSVIANFAATFGATIGQNGCAGIYPAMLAVMVAPTVGIDPFSVQYILSLILIVAISSFGIAGVGGGATFAAIVVLSALNLPLALVGLLISIEPLIDMGRTALNVNGAMVAGTLSDRILNKKQK
ncbi:L-cystine transporter [Campylobacter pinnipediorum]|uniref:L-cystine transporter tcyP n=1 Tax=Campylobacter pinnipediorum subsp. pinnipediorum TaxID=1660067 RepID=A0AAX0LAV2_9BACT|nr:L-cystine transporter [Campylobacter pinnipediorum]AQW81812.1 Na+/dicarboxylate symporter [Campylobacter pinnipediorum subsp. pinnipediorum]AQW83488.1 Na+/dicarboxylate symporter [Campylobacter pinnipediorum subsp. pinnipediorum]AQW85008.1 Na+/dicarboxylate symporter [Campylobacter pinnipediorum subsp. pinnipediorum]OPA76398.1 L-cystine transporter tcyP [Campylobacter pinnipediorum subsp. pinnipediorum]